MTATTSYALVIGRGLLGGAVERWPSPSEVRCIATKQRVWQKPDLLAASFNEDIERLLQAAGDAPFRIFWCAGVGHLSANPDSQAAESSAFRVFCELLSNHLSERNGRPGTVIFASSAGGVYGDSIEWPVNEMSPVAPFGPYGHSKLEQESILRKLLGQNTQVRPRVARISTAYGAGQSLSKPQGLISHIFNNILSKQVTVIRGSLDIRRDFVHVRSVAQMLHTLADESVAPGQPSFDVRLVASARSTTIAEIIGLAQRITRRRVPWVTVPDRAGPAELSFKPIRPLIKSAQVVGLAEGMSQVLWDIERRRRDETASR